ncbi:hypothetical protein DH09_12095 [Bacillaceae bacterium JMAK1]|nr:hypothetical protein DH09_12095 [Bacillaceae bacterium JMAK1]
MKQNSAVILTSDHYHKKGVLESIEKLRSMSNRIYILIAFPSDYTDDITSSYLYHEVKQIAELETMSTSLDFLSFKDFSHLRKEIALFLDKNNITVVSTPRFKESFYEELFEESLPIQLYKYFYNITLILTEHLSEEPDSQDFEQGIRMVLDDDGLLVDESDTKSGIKGLFFKYKQTDFNNGVFLEEGKLPKVYRINNSVAGKPQQNLM